MSRSEFVGAPYPGRVESKEIVFIRHAESQANVDGVWNGRTDGPLSPAGEASLEPLARRLSDWEFDAVISSPLERAVRTAESFAGDVEIRDEFVEIDLGRFEGLPFEEVQATHGAELHEALSTRTTPMGGTGESLQQAAERALGAVDGLFHSMGDASRVAVVTHGGFLQSVLHRHLAGKSHRVHSFTANTAITRVMWQYGHPRLAAFNDTGHLGPRPSTVTRHLDSGNPVIAFVRHGRTRANVEQRWQGHGDWDLDEVGMSQAEALGRWFGRHDVVYSSPLSRAMSTAGQVAKSGVVPLEEFKELAMGYWEGLTTEDIARGWPDLMERIYRHGVDLRRGETGESWSELAARFRSGVKRVETSLGQISVVVAHGGAIRSYISSLTATDDTHSESLFTPPNTSVTHVAYTPRGPEIVDFAVATHLEGLQ